MLGIRFRLGRLDPVKGLERYLTRRPRPRHATLIVSTLAILVACFVYVIRPVLTGGWSTIGLSISALLGFIGLITFSIALKSYQVADWLELSDARRKSAKLQDKIGQQPDVFEIVQLSLSQLSEYYTINKSQARKSFNFSVFAIAVGLATIIAGVWLMYAKRLGTGVGAISAVSGLLLQFFGGANFYIYNKSLVQMNYFYDRLMQMQDTMLSIKVGDQIQDAKLKDKVKEHIASQLLLKSHEKVPVTTSRASQKRPRGSSAEAASAAGAS